MSDNYRENPLQQPHSADTLELMRQRIEFALESADDTGEFMDKSLSFFGMIVGHFEKVARTQSKITWLIGLVALFEVADLVASLIAIHHR